MFIAMYDERESQLRYRVSHIKTTLGLNSIVTRGEAIRLYEQSLRASEGEAQVEALESEDSFVFRSHAGIWTWESKHYHCTMNIPESTITVVSVATGAVVFHAERVTMNRVERVIASFFSVE